MAKNFKNTIGDHLQKKTGALLQLRTTNDLPSHPSWWTEDGVDHINVSPKGKTKIGKWLNARNSFPFTHPLLGSFRSIDNLSMFIRAETLNDRIRTMDNFAKIRDTITKNGGMRKIGRYYEAIMVHSVYVRIMQNEALMHDLLTNVLPFDSYTVDEVTGLRQRFEPTAYLCKGFAEIATALKENRTPNLRQFVTGGAADLNTVYAELVQRLIPGYQGDVNAVFTQFESARWASYAEWLARRERDAQRRVELAERKSAQKVKAAPMSQVIEEVGGIPNVVMKQVLSITSVGSDSTADGYIDIITEITGPESYAVQDESQDKQAKDSAAALYTAAVKMCDHLNENAWQGIVTTQGHSMPVVSVELSTSELEQANADRLVLRRNAEKHHLPVDAVDAFYAASAEMLDQANEVVQQGILNAQEHLTPAADGQPEGELEDGVRYENRWIAEPSTDYKTGSMEQTDSTLAHDTMVMNTGLESLQAGEQALQRGLQPGLVLVDEVGVVNIQALPGTPEYLEVTGAVDTVLVN